MTYQPGPIALFGSGEIAPAGRRVHEALFRRLKPPIRVVVLETPAGFQPNSAWVADRLAEFIRERLQNFHPDVTVVPARRRDGPFSTDDPQRNAPLLRANYVFMGPGSPTYAVRHLKDTWAWEVIRARQRMGAVLAFASAMAIAAGTWALPVYEIYKAGADLFWAEGLDLFRPYGLELAIVSHWDNTEGGPNLDTRRGFMGVERMERLLEILPPTTTLLGIDEHTAVVLDFAAGTARVMGRGGVTIRKGNTEHVFSSGQTFPLNLLGEPRIPALEEGISPAVLEAILRAEEGPAVPAEVLALAAEREEARRAKDWARADRLREEIRTLGFIVEDTHEGPRLRPAGKT